MIPIYSTQFETLEDVFLNPSRIEIDSPLLGERIDETKESLSKFGCICIIFAGDSTPSIKKINQWEKCWKTSAYFFQPTWERKGNPFENASYFVHLKEWVLQKGGLSLSPSQKETLVKVLDMLKSKGLPVNFDEQLKQSLMANPSTK